MKSIEKNAYCFEMRGKQSIKRGVWHIGGRRRRRQRGGAFPLGRPLEVAKPIFKTIIGRGIQQRKRRRRAIW